MGPLWCALWSIFRLIPRPISVFAPDSWLCAILPLSFAFPTIPTLLQPTRLASRGRSLRLRWTKWRLRACLSKPTASRRGPHFWGRAATPHPPPLPPPPPPIPPPPPPPPPPP